MSYPRLSTKLAPKGPRYLFSLFVLLNLAAMEDAWAVEGQIATLHNRRPIALKVNLPEFDLGQPFSSALVTMIDLPSNMIPDASGCFCFDLSDDRFAIVHGYYHAHTTIASYNRLLAEIGMPPLTGVQFKLARDTTIPTTGSASLRRVPKIDMTFPTPAVEVFTLVHEIGHLIDYHISPRHQDSSQPWGGMRSDAEEGGVGEGTANLLAALHLGTTGPPLFTDDALDSPPANDIDTFIRFPDLVIKRRDVFESIANAPRFAARYAEFVESIRVNLENPDMREYLDQPDEYASSAVINQPLWQAAVKFGFNSVRRLYLRTLAQWQGTEVNYSTLARQLIDQARTESPDLGAELRAAYAERGLAIEPAR
jgi:hypothetical protein